MNTKTEIIDLVQEYLSGDRVFAYIEMSDLLDRLVDNGVEAGRYIEHDWEYWKGYDECFKKLHHITPTDA